MSFFSLKQSLVLFAGLGFYAAIQAAPTAIGDFEYTLPPNDPQRFINYTMFKIKGECRISIPDHSEVQMRAKGLGGSGEVDFNDGQGPHKVSEDDAAPFTAVIKDNQVIFMTAEAAAQVELTNLGNQVVTASCHLL